MASQEPRTVEISARDLPLHCPARETALWCSHPRIFLDPAVSGEALCPYCGTRYRLKAGETAHTHG